jgi:hypothetical protein
VSAIDEVILALRRAARLPHAILVGAHELFSAQRANVCHLQAFDSSLARAE